MDQVVAGGAIEAVVPLLTHFPGPDSDPSIARYLTLLPLCCPAACNVKQECSPANAACDAVCVRPCSGEEVEKEACFILGLLAIKQEHQHAIADQVGPP